MHAQRGVNHHSVSQAEAALLTLTSKMPQGFPHHCCRDAFAHNPVVPSHVIYRIHVRMPPCCLPFTPSPSRSAIYRLLYGPNTGKNDRVFFTPCELFISDVIWTLLMYLPVLAWNWSIEESSVIDDNPKLCSTQDGSHYGSTRNL